MDKSESIKAARREYARRYRQEHPDRVKAAQERYWIKKALELEQREQDDSPTQA